MFVSTKNQNNFLGSLFFKYKPVLLQKFCGSPHCKIFPAYCVYRAYFWGEVWGGLKFLPTLLSDQQTPENSISLMFICKGRKPSFIKDTNCFYFVLNSLAKCGKKSRLLSAVFFVDQTKLGTSNAGGWARLSAGRIKERWCSGVSGDGWWWPGLFLSIFDWNYCWRYLWSLLSRCSSSVVK